VADLSFSCGIWIAEAPRTLGQKGERREEVDFSALHGERLARHDMTNMCIRYYGRVPEVSPPPLHIVICVMSLFLLAPIFADARIYTIMSRYSRYSVLR